MFDKLMKTIVYAVNHHSWTIDAGASDHICCSLKFFTYAKPVHNMLVQKPTGTKALATHVGKVRLTASLTLQNVLCVPSFKFNLISVSKLTETKQHCIVVTDLHCIIPETTHGLWLILLRWKLAYSYKESRPILKVDFNLYVLFFYFPGVIWMCFFKLCQCSSWD